MTPGFIRITGERYCRQQRGTNTWGVHDRAGTLRGRGRREAGEGQGRRHQQLLAGHETGRRESIGGGQARVSNDGYAQGQDIQNRS